MKSAIPIVVGIAAIAAAGWWISGSAESDAEAPARVNMEVLADGDRLAETDPGAPEITTNRRPESLPSIETETYTRSDAAAEDMVSVELYRIDPDSGDERPVPNADVWFLPGDEETTVKAQAQMRSGATTLQVMRALGRLFRANSKGRAEVPREPSNSSVTAMVTGLRGFGSNRGVKSGAVRIKLEPVTTLLARIVDTAGKPVVGILVFLIFGEARPVAVGMSSGKDGIAEVSFEATLWGTESADGPFHLRISAPLLETVEQEVALDDLPTGPVTLVLPPTGTLVVKDGREPGATRTQAGVEVRVAGAKNQSMESQLAALLPHFFTDGVARVEHVGLGMRLDLKMQDRAGFSAESLDVAGPTSPGETVEVTLRPVQTKPLVAFRLVDEDGEPRRKLGIRFRTRDGVVSSGSGLRTDDDGRGRVPITGWRGSTRSLDLWIDDGSGNENMMAAYSVDLSRELPLGTTDLGDIRLRPAPLIVSGIVVDGAGEPIAGASLQFEKRRSETRPARWSFANIRSDGLPSGSDGTFTVRGFNMAKESHRVRTHREGYICQDPVEFTFGTADLRIVMSSAGAFAGRVLLPEDVTDGINLCMTPEGGDREQKGPRLLMLIEHDRGNRFSFKSVPPGTYQLSVSVNGASEPVALIPGIQIRGGETTSDPRLNPIDLREVVASAQVMVVGPDGAPVKGAKLTMEVGRSSWGVGDRTDKKGVTRFVFDRRGAAPRLRVEKKGYLSQEIARIRPVMRVTLKPSPSVVLRVSPDAVAAAKPRELRVRLKALGEVPRGFHGTDSVAVSAEGVARIVVPRAGLYQTQWSLSEPVQRRPNGRYTTIKETSLEVPSFVESGDKIEVLPADHDREIPVNLTRSDIEKAMAKAEKKGKGR